MLQAKDEVLKVKLVDYFIYGLALAFIIDAILFGYSNNEVVSFGLAGLSLFAYWQMVK
jgi:hypothetical protein